MINGVLSSDLQSLFHTLLLFFIKSCHKLEYKDKWWFDETMSVTFCMESTEKKNSFIPSPNELTRKLALANMKNTKGYCHEL